MNSNELQNTMNSVVNYVTALENKVKARDDKIIELTNENDDLRLKLNTLQQENTTLTNTLAKRDSHIELLSKPESQVVVA